MRCISPFDNGSYHMGTIRTNRTNRQLGQASLSIQRVGHSQSPANEMLSPFDNGSYHMGTIRTNRTNRQLERGFLGLQRVRNILSPPNEMHFSIQQRVYSESTIRQQLHSFFTTRIYSSVLDNPLVCRLLMVVFKKIRNALKLRIIL